MMFPQFGIRFCPLIIHSGDLFIPTPQQTQEVLESSLGKWLLGLYSSPEFEESSSNS